MGTNVDFKKRQREKKDSSSRVGAQVTDQPNSSPKDTAAVRTRILRTVAWWVCNTILPPCAFVFGLYYELLFIVGNTSLDKASPSRPFLGKDFP